MTLIDLIKQLGWKKLISIGLSSLVLIFGGFSVIHSLVSPTRSARVPSPLPSALPSPVIDCPDRIEHDSMPAPLWIKGTVQKRITGEQEATIMALCASPSPNPLVETSTSPKAKTTASAKKLVTKISPTAAPEPKLTATSATPVASPSPSPTPVASPSANPSPTPSPSPASPPVLKNLGVNFAPYDAQSGRAGAFDFLKLQRKPFVEFGDNGQEPTFTYLIAEDADVTAIADGYVYKVEYQSQYADYSILASTEKDVLTWSIDYDHVINPIVNVGDKITAGQKLGIAGTHSDLGIGRLEIQVFGGEPTSSSYCPFNYFDSSLIASYKEKLQKLMDDYEAYMFNTAVYPESYTTGHIGCLVSSIAN